MLLYPDKNYYRLLEILEEMVVSHGYCYYNIHIVIRYAYGISLLCNNNSANMTEVLKSIADMSTCVLTWAPFQAQSLSCLF